MKIELLPVVECEQLTSTVFALHLRSSYLSKNTKPGQFVNIKVQSIDYPLLRRPFSVAYADADIITILFEIVGEGTRILSEKKTGELVDVLGPLGSSFTLAKKDTTTILVAGGLGVAPMPLLTERLTQNGTERLETFLGARSKEQLVNYRLKNVHFATDDGSEGFHGTVVALLDDWFEQNKDIPVTVYACGPNQMLRALQEMLHMRSLQGQVSLECVMACGIGICQGCPVESSNSTKRYRLVCKDGPVFDIHSVIIQ